jgi:hypothetical protein
MATGPDTWGAAGAAGGAGAGFADLFEYLFGNDWQFDDSCP